MAPQRTAHYLVLTAFQMPTPKEDKFHHQLPNDEQTVAYELCDELRYAIQSKAEVILIELLPNPCYSKKIL